MARKNSKGNGNGSEKVYQVITDRIIALLEKGTVPWRKLWNGSAHCSIRGHVYRGINAAMLGATAMSEGYESNVWVTYNQARELGGSVRKGEQGTPVVFWKWIEKESKSDDGETETKRFPILRYYTVFNADQCDGVKVPARLQLGEAPDPISECETIVAGYEDAPSITNGGDMACYSPSQDAVRMPPRAAFAHIAEYYSVLFHELTHSTGHASRLARAEVMAPSFFGSHDYSREELVAEFGAAFLCGRAGIDAATLDNSAAYIQGWMRKLTDDPKLVVKAAAAAQKAVDHITGEERE